MSLDFSPDRFPPLYGLPDSQSKQEFLFRDGSYSGFIDVDEAQLEVLFSFTRQVR